MSTCFVGTIAILLKLETERNIIRARRGRQLNSTIFSAMLIGLWIADEFSFDRFHAKEDRLYMMHRQETEGRNATLNWTPKVLAPTLKSDFPEIEDVARWRKYKFSDVCWRPSL